MIFSRTQGDIRQNAVRGQEAVGTTGHELTTDYKWFYYWSETYTLPNEGLSFGTGSSSPPLLLPTLFLEVEQTGKQNPEFA